jgi:ATP-dependent RNA helicase DDX10/DBP4
MQKQKFKKNPSKFNKFNKSKPKFNKVKGKKLTEDGEIKEIKEKYENMPNPADVKTFHDFPLSKRTLKGLLQNKFKFPTEIQKQSIGSALLGKDILGAAQTGSGKTLGKIFNRILGETLTQLPLLCSIFNSYS